MLWYTLLSIILLGMLLPMIYASVKEALRETIEAKLRMEISQVIASAESEDGTVSIDDNDVSLNEGTYLTVLTGNSQEVYTSHEADWLNTVETDNQDYKGYVSHDGNRYYVVRQSTKSDDAELIITSAADTEDMDTSLSSLVQMLYIIVPLYLVISAAGAYLLSRRAMKPISRITATAAQIADGDMSRRIEGINTRDEVGELSSTFNKMLDELETSFKRERQFTSDASHELRTPVSIISACAEDALGHSIPSDERENILSIKSESEKMTHIISQLLMLSRGQEGRYRFEKDNICLYDVAESVSAELSPQAEMKHISIHNEITEDLTISADQSLMTQLFMNLTGNAIKYGRENGNVTLAARTSGSNIIISFSDDGIGISNEDLPHIFERFYRADKVRDRSGSGLGLAIVKWIAELHKGSVSVESTPGNGSTFIVTIPLE